MPEDHMINELKLVASKVRERAKEAEKEREGRLINLKEEDFILPDRFSNLKK